MDRLGLLFWKVVLPFRFSLTGAEHVEDKLYTTLHISDWYLNFRKYQDIVVKSISSSPRWECWDMDEDLTVSAERERNPVLELDQQANCCSWWSLGVVMETGTIKIRVLMLMSMSFWFCVQDGYSEPCGQCGAVSWALSEGLQYFCRNCHNVIEVQQLSTLVTFYEKHIPYIYIPYIHLIFTLFMSVLFWGTEYISSLIHSPLKHWTWGGWDFSACVIYEF